MWITNVTVFTGALFWGKSGCLIFGILIITNLTGILQLVFTRCQLLNTEAKVVNASFYRGAAPTVKTSITVHVSGDISVHSRQLPSNHELLDYVPKSGSVVDQVKSLIQWIQKYSLCIGNPDDDIVTLTPVGAGLSLPDLIGLGAYQEGNFNATCGNFTYLLIDDPTHRVWTSGRDWVCQMPQGARWIT